MSDLQTQRKKIHVLPEALINKIAAGEVVERPASVVKELLENSIDAGARRLSITIEDGGRTLIRIADDGQGIPADEAPLAFSQHATSKLQDAEGLFAITTMGFRGEALASIASVSHATMVTRTADSQQALRIEVKDSLATAGVPCAAAPGTTIEVRDLFYIVPARRKFMRTDATEFSHIHEMVLRAALPHPQIALSLSHNGRPVLDLPATLDHRLRVAEALGKELYPQLIPLDFAERGIRVTGFAGQPALARATAKYQYLFLNGRYIRDRALFHGVKEAYRGLIEPASQPVAIVLLEMDPSLFDVNVHPQKTEVRFRDSGAVYRSVLAALREKLLASDLTPQVRTANRFDEPDSPLALVNDQTPAQSAQQTRDLIADFFKHSPPVQSRLHYGVEARQPSAIDDPSRITFPQHRTPSVSEWTEQGGDPSIGEQLANVREPPRDVPLQSTTPAAEPLPADEGAVNDDPSKIENQKSKIENRFLQVHSAYIVAETADGLVIIDQHALHERILYEELFARVTRGPLEGQRLLIPEVLPINPRQAAALEPLKPLLASLGIEITDFDAGSVAVHSFPSLLAKVAPGEFLRDLLDKLMDLGGGGPSRLTPEELLHEVLDMASCKAAIKAGYPLSSEEIAALFARKEHVDRSSNCPHGRPTTLRLGIGDLERQFKRK